MPGLRWKPWCGAVGCPRLAFKHGYQNKRLNMTSNHLPRISTQSFSELGLDAMCRQYNGCSKGGGGGGGGGVDCNVFVFGVHLHYRPVV